MAQAPLKIAAPLICDMDFDNYGGLVRFGLHRLVPPPAGAYGFFARLTSDQYHPSDPFLVMLNYGQLTGQQMIAAALGRQRGGGRPGNARWRLQRRQPGRCSRLHRLAQWAWIHLYLRRL